MNVRIPFSAVNLSKAFTAAAIALTCVSIAACQSRAAPAQQRAAAASPSSATVNSLQGMEPAGPSDETPITPFETVGASMVN